MSWMESNRLKSVCLGRAGHTNEHARDVNCLSRSVSVCLSVCLSRFACLVSVGLSVSVCLSLCDLRCFHWSCSTQAMAHLYVYIYIYMYIYIYLYIESPHHSWRNKAVHHQLRARHRQTTSPPWTHQQQPLSYAPFWPLGSTSSGSVKAMQKLHTIWNHFIH